MKVIKIKRLIYTHIMTGEVLYGSEEYDGNLSDENILNSVHEVGKTEWRPTAWGGTDWENELWLLIPDANNPKVKYPMYRIYVDEFYRYEKTWWDIFCDKVKRVLHQ